jgi:hypothetical protein
MPFHQLRKLTMSSLWDMPGVPHKGWTCQGVEDVRVDGETPEEAYYRVCEMCGKERIRFVHTMAHPGFDRELRVGCVCAERMSDDYTAPKVRERELRNRSARRAKWLARKWKTSRKGHPWLQAGDFHIVVYSENVTQNRFRLCINQKRGQRTYGSEEAAKLAGFDAIEKMKQRRRRAS